MSLTKKEEEKYYKFSKFAGKNVVISLTDGDPISGKLDIIENPDDVEPEYPMFIVEKTPDAPNLIGVYLNQIKEIKLAK